MPWNWELPEWPNFIYHPEKIAQYEKEFLLKAGEISAFTKALNTEDYNYFIVEILGQEGLESSKIEGEILDRESLQSSIKRQFGLQTTSSKKGVKESRMAQVLCDVYRSFDLPLTHEILWDWHLKLFGEESSGTYRTHEEPMQIISNRHGAAKTFFEAPPSSEVAKEMNHFITWFNSTQNANILVKAAIGHLYFESIHPFEDGNGRIGRLLVEKILSQGVKKPLLIAVSIVLEKKKKEYYAELEKCNRTLKVQHWVDFFAKVVLEAQEESTTLLNFLITKSKTLNRLSTLLNSRQEKVLLRMFAEGPTGFVGGLSAENYMSITKTSRATTTRDLTDLIEKGALRKTGELKSTRYWLIF